MILLDEQRTAILLKRAVPLFIAQIVILFIRIGEQRAEIALFLFSIRFGQSRIDEQRGLFIPQETNRPIEEQLKNHLLLTHINMSSSTLPATVDKFTTAIGAELHSEFGIPTLDE